MDGVKFFKNNISIAELEKHLSDYKKRKAKNSLETAAKIPSAKINSALNLSEINPKASLNYSLYSTSLNYSSNARYVKNIDDALPHIRKIFSQSA